MLVRRFGIRWRAVELDVCKVPTLFRVLCKLHNLCTDHWIIEEILPFSRDSNLLRAFDITVGLDDVGYQPTNEEVTERLSNKYEQLSQRRRLSVNNTQRDAMTEELYHGGIRL
jgi:hypothetical protein